MNEMYEHRVRFFAWQVWVTNDYNLIGDIGYEYSMLIRPGIGRIRGTVGPRGPIVPEQNEEVELIVHVLKCLPNYFDAIESGDKNFDVRRDDRGFQKGDIVRLQKYSLDDGYHRDPKEVYKTHQIERTIKYILTGGQFGIESGYVVLGF